MVNFIIICNSVQCSQGWLKSADLSAVDRGSCAVCSCSSTQLNLNPLTDQTWSFLVNPKSLLSSVLED